MLEFGIHQGLHQGSSLCSPIAGDGPRLITVARASDGASLRVALDMCAHLQHLGYATVMLDATARETEAAPGLVDLLDHGLCIDAAPALEIDSRNSVAVLPSARGLATLDLEMPAPQALQSLSSVLRPYAVAVLYAPLEQLTSSLLEACGAAPLIVLGDGHEGVLNAYGQLKALAVHAGLRAIVAGLTRPGRDARFVQTQLNRVCQCAENHLGRPPRTAVVNPTHPADMQRLALALLENAVPLAPTGLAAALPWFPVAARGAAHPTSH